MKGSIFDVLIMGISLFVLAVGIAIAAIIISSVQTSTSDILTSATAQEALQQGVNAVGTFNYGFVVIAVGLGLGSVILAILVPSHPIFMIVSIISLMIFMVILPIFSNAFGLLQEESSFSAVSSNFSLMNAIMNNLPLFGAVFGALIIIAMYTRYRSGGQA
jgi:hypothetical protein